MNAHVPSEWKGPARGADILADLLATVARGRRAREAAERRMAEDPPEDLEAILAPYAPRPLAVLRASPARRV